MKTKIDWKEVAEKMLADKQAIEAYFEDPITNPLPAHIKFTQPLTLLKKAEPEAEV